jgi:hypothetical protein
LLKETRAGCEKDAPPCRRSEPPVHVGNTHAAAGGAVCGWLYGVVCKMENLCRYFGPTAASAAAFSSSALSTRSKSVSASSSSHSSAHCSSSSLSSRSAPQSARGKRGGGGVSFRARSYRTNYRPLRARRPPSSLRTLFLELLELVVLVDRLRRRQLRDSRGHSRGHSDRSGCLGVHRRRCAGGGGRHLSASSPRGEEERRVDQRGKGWGRGAGGCVGEASKNVFVRASSKVILFKTHRASVLPGSRRTSRLLYD